MLLYAGCVYWPFKWNPSIGYIVGGVVIGVGVRVALIGRRNVEPGREHLELRRPRRGFQLSLFQKPSLSLRGTLQRLGREGINHSPTEKYAGVGSTPAPLVVEL